MKKVLPTLVILILIGVLGTIFYKTYYVKYSYSAEKADVNAYYGVQSEDDYPVVLQDQLSDYHARKMGDHFYLDLAAVRELINDRFYYSEEDGELSYCLPETRVYAQEGSSTWKDTSGNETTEDYEICVQVSRTARSCTWLWILYPNTAISPTRPSPLPTVSDCIRNGASARKRLLQEIPVCGYRAE